MILHTLLIIYLVTTVISIFVFIPTTYYELREEMCKRKAIVKTINVGGLSLIPVANFIWSMAMEASLLISMCRIIP